MKHRFLSLLSYATVFCVYCSLMFCGNIGICIFFLVIFSGNGIVLTPVLNRRNYYGDPWENLVEEPDHSNCNVDIYKSGKLTAYIINLDRAKKRWQYILPQVAAIGISYERIAAVDGCTLSWQKIDEIVDFENYGNYFNMMPEVGTIGCSLSHEIFWKLFLESDNEFAIVFEDDVKFDPNQLPEVIQDLMRKKHLWDIVSFELNHNGHPLKIAKLPLGKSLVFYLTSVKHTGAYMINRKAADLLLRKFYPIKMPVDHYFTRSWEFGLKFCGVEPRMVEQKFGDSQIKVSKNAKITSFPMRFFSFCYQLNTCANQAVYNFYCYLFNKIFG